MKRTLLHGFLLACFILPLQIRAQDADGIDWNRARQLFQRAQRGDALNAEDRAYLNRAKTARQRGGQPVARNPIPQRQAPERLTPLCDMSATDRYEGQEGGLYGNGSNEPPPALLQATQAALAKIQPLNKEGQPDADGRIVLISISMSNATQEFSTFKRIADADPRKSKNLTIVDGAQGGQAMAEWAPPDGRPWQEALRRLEAARVTPAQVQTAWIKLANKSPSGSMSEHLQKLENDTRQVIANARQRFPNLRVIYLGSRIWGGYATGALNPEPYAYESAFAVRRLIQQQDLKNTDAPVLIWGPYLWAEGERGRKIDNLTYVRADFVGDGVHPSESGRNKVARQLLEYFAGSPLAQNWFAAR